MTINQRLEFHPPKKTTTNYYFPCSFCGLGVPRWPDEVVAPFGYYYRQQKIKSFTNRVFILLLQHGGPKLNCDSYNVM